MLFLLLMNSLLKLKITEEKQAQAFYSFFKVKNVASDANLDFTDKMTRFMN